MFERIQKEVDKLEQNYIEIMHGIQDLKEQNLYIKDRIKVLDFLCKHPDGTAFVVAEDFVSGDIPYTVMFVEFVCCDKLKKLQIESDDYTVDGDYLIGKLNKYKLNRVLGTIVKIETEKAHGLETKKSNRKRISKKTTASKS